MFYWKNLFLPNLIKSFVAARSGNTAQSADIGIPPVVAELSDIVSITKLSIAGAAFTFEDDKVDHVMFSFKGCDPTTWQALYDKIVEFYSPDTFSFRASPVDYGFASCHPDAIGKARAILGAQYRANNVKANRLTL